jgi:hypothetical protein
MSELGEVNKYSNASIYTIRNYKDDSLIYVGSTISPIHKRLCSHKSHCRNGKSGSLYNHIIDNDWSDWYLELYERFPCNDRAELCKREGEVIREIGTINKNIAGRTHKESDKNWHENNPNYMKEWRDSNHTKYSEYMKLYMREYNARKRSATP